MPIDKTLFYHIARSHMYWGRKPLYSIDLLFKDLEAGETVIDPFCGGGSAVVVALSKGARVLASDVNPMAVFLTRVLIQPLSISSLLRSFDYVRDIIENVIQQKYYITCPQCKQETSFDYLKWEGTGTESKPLEARITCKKCRYSGFNNLTSSDIDRQMKNSLLEPRYWYPTEKISTYRRTNVDYYYELFTPRNLSALSELNYAIEKVQIKECRDLLHYVFTSILYSCSQMQMYSNRYRSSSRGWTAPRFYMPSQRQEKNVWKSFETRFKNILLCKSKLNEFLPFIDISNDYRSFENGNSNAYIYVADFKNIHFGNRESIRHIYLDPPYVDDVDYLGFSKFWGTWLKMQFDDNMGWHPHKTSNENNSSMLYELLYSIKNNTTLHTIVTIAFGAKHKRAWNWMYDAIERAGYYIEKIDPIIWDHSQKRGSGSQIDFYISLKRMSKERHVTTVQYTPRIVTKESEQPVQTTIEGDNLETYIRSSIFLHKQDRIRSKSTDAIRAFAHRLIPSQRSSEIEKYDTSAIEKMMEDAEANRNAYHDLCLDIIRIILKNDNLNVAQIERSLFRNIKDYSIPVPDGVCRGAAFVAEGKNLKIAFCFEDQDEKQLKDISNAINKSDERKFETICVMIVRTYESLIKRREYNNADQWPRGFFILLDDIITKARDVNPEQANSITSYISDYQESIPSARGVKEFNAEVLENIPVGELEDDPSKHYILVIKSRELRDIAPGQFIMIDTRGERRIEPKTKTTSVAVLQSKSRHKNDLFEKRSFLKRPFGIHRASYKNFDVGYLKTLSLPCTLASITHTVFPHKFEVFYKVIDDGVGTNELKGISVGSRLRVLGPLGKKIKLSDLRKEGIEEVHLIGGGVGMAPLIYIGQGLRYYSFSVKAFVGIDSFKKLVYRDYHALSMGEDSRKARVYIDGLTNIGLCKNDIYMSYETAEACDELEESHIYNGFVTDQYRDYLSKNSSGRKIMAITCGPIPMMKRLSSITDNHNIPLKVLLEKRMACGIGVCLSCVCRKKRGDNSSYVRVCTDGPLFNAEDIVWD